MGEYKGGGGVSIIEREVLEYKREGGVSIREREG